MCVLGVHIFIVWGHPLLADMCFFFPGLKGHDVFRSVQSPVLGYSGLHGRPKPETLHPKLRALSGLSSQPDEAESCQHRLMPAHEGLTSVEGCAQKDSNIHWYRFSFI